MKTADRAPLRRQVMLWQWHETRWRRYHVREWVEGRTEHSELFRVEAKLPVCLNCLSHDVEQMSPDAAGVVRLQCNACDVRFHMVV